MGILHSQTGRDAGPVGKEKKTYWASVSLWARTPSLIKCVLCTTTFHQKLPKPSIWNQHQKSLGFLDSNICPDNTQNEKELSDPPSSFHLQWAESAGVSLCCIIKKQTALSCLSEAMWDGGVDSIDFPDLRGPTQGKKKYLMKVYLGLAQAQRLAQL